MNKIFITALFAIWAALPFNASAQLYGAVGSSFMSVADDDPFATLASVGYRFGAIALEGGIFNPTTLTDTTVTSTAMPSTSTAIHDASTQRRKMDGYSLKALFYLPLSDKANAFGMLGAYRVKAKLEGVEQRSTYNVSDSGAFTLTSLTAIHSSWESTQTLPTIGFGVRYDLSKNIAVRASLERMGAKGGMFGPGQDINYIDMRNVEFLLTF